MATLTRGLSLFIDSDKTGGISASLDGKLSSKPSYPPALMAGDRFTVKLFFRQRDAQNGASTFMDLPAGSVVVLAGRGVSGNQLFVATEFVAAGVGTDNSCYSGNLNLGTAEVAYALAQTAYGSSIPIYLDVEVRDAANTERISYRIEATLYKEVYSDTGPIPSTLAASYLLSPDGSNWQLSVADDGVLSVRKVGQAEADPDFIQLQAANFQAPGGYYWALTVDDEGQISTARLS